MTRRGNVRGGGVCGNPNPVVMEMLRGIATRIEAIEMTHGRGRHVKDVSDDEEE